MAARIKGHENRIERLESLEHANEAFLPFGQCLYYEEKEEHLAQAIFTLEPHFLTLEDDFCNSHLWVTWRLRCAESSACVNLLMTYNLDVGANYEYAAAYTKGGAMTNLAAGGATGIVVGRIPGSLVSSTYFGTGSALLVMPGYGQKHGVTSQWEMYDSTQSAGSRHESGHGGGTNTNAMGIVWRISLRVASGSKMEGVAHLYSICPPWYCGESPPD